jgi:arylamine N-acetyltransferase
MNEQPEYKKFLRVVAHLDQGGLLERMNGNCLTACEVLQSLMAKEGIDSEIIECDLIVCKKTEGGITPVKLIGFNTMVGAPPFNIDTHTALLVKAKEQPFLADISIGYVLNDYKFVLASPLCSTSPDIIADSQWEDWHFTYRVKKNIKLPHVHQKTLLERANTELKIRKDVTTLSWLVRILIAVGIFNMFANSWLLILKFMYP